MELMSLQLRLIYGYQCVYVCKLWFKNKSNILLHIAEIEGQILKMYFLYFFITKV